MRRAPVLATVAALTLGFAPAFAQDASIGVKAPSPQRATLPSLQYEATQPSDDNYPLGSVRILYDPAFFTQFSVPIETPTSTGRVGLAGWRDRKSTRLNSSHVRTSYAVFCLKKKSILELSALASF